MKNKYAVIENKIFISKQYNRQTSKVYQFLRSVALEVDYSGGGYLMFWIDWNVISSVEMVLEYHFDFTEVSIEELVRKL